MPNNILDNRKIKGGVICTPGENTNNYYRRGDDSFNIIGSFDGLETRNDWALLNTKEKNNTKSGVLVNYASRKTAQIRFKNSFPNNDYYVFFSCSDNINIYTINKEINGFTIKASSNLPEEVSWFAIHKNLSKKTGNINTGILYAGSRTINRQTTSEENMDYLTNPVGLSYEELNILLEEHTNLSGWYKHSYIIKPEKTEFDFPMNLHDYSVFLTTNININIYWKTKRPDRVEIGTSFPEKCIIDYMFIKKGMNWWDEF